MAYKVEQMNNTGRSDEFSMICAVSPCTPGQREEVAGVYMEIVRPLTPSQARANNPAVFRRFIHEFPDDVLLWYEVRILRNPHRGFKEDEGV